MVSQNKIFSFEIKRQAKSIFLSDVERTVFLLLLCFIDILVLNANNVEVETDQMPHSAASELSLHCLPVTLWWVSDK